MDKYIGIDVHAASCTIAVVDARGRQVKSLADRAYPAGRHSVVWAGDSDAGTPLGSGIYFVRIQAGDFAARHKVMLTR